MSSLRTGTIVRDAEGYIFNDTKILKKLVSNALVQCVPSHKPEVQLQGFIKLCARVCSWAGATECFDRRRVNGASYRVWLLSEYARPECSECWRCPARGLMMFRASEKVRAVDETSQTSDKALAHSCRKPEAPDWVGDMNPFWQTLDQIFGAHFNATTKESSSHYTEFFHPVRSLA